MSLKVEETKTQQAELLADEARAIARDAYVYGFPLVDSYRIQYAYFVDKDNPEYKGNWNEIHNTARVYTPDDKAVQTPNSDTPYSFVGVDLRTEPVVLTVPSVEKERYYSIQFVDMYTFNFAYAGSRTTSNEAGNFLLAGPNWKGDKPSGIKQMIQSETELVLLLYRTQLFNPDDLGNVKKVQAGYKIQSLSQFLNQPAPAPAPIIEFMKPLGVQEQKASLEFFNQLNFILQFCPAHPSETGMMKRFAKMDIGANKNFSANNFSPEIKKAIEDGLTDAWKVNEEVHNMAAAGKAGSGDFFGTRVHLKNNYPYRMAAAVAGIYGNSQEEAIYPVYYLDSSGQPLNASSNRYTLRFAAGQLPPVNAFWSLTAYEMPSSLLYANPLNRYLINSPMLADLKKNEDGGLTLYVQNESPGKDRESNWLPAPKGKLKLVLRLYWPKKEALDGTWKAPPMMVNSEW